MPSTVHNGIPGFIPQYLTSAPRSFAISTSHRSTNTAKSADSIKVSERRVLPRHCYCHDDELNKPNTIYVDKYFASILYNLFLHPLSKYPGPLLGRVSGWQNWSWAASGDRHLHLYRQHQEYGPIVRFAPNSISINTAEALQEIYGSRKANVVKSDWYRTIQYSEKLKPSTFTAINTKQHAQKRRVLSQAFSENALRDMESQIIDHVRNWCNHVGKGATKSKWSEGKNMSTWADYFTFDVLSDLAFGKPLDVYDKEDNRFIIELLPTAVKSLYELGYHPWSSFLRKLMFQTPLGDLAGGQMVRDHKRFTSFADGALAQRVEAQNDTEKAGAAPGRKDIFYHLFKGKDPETGEGYTRGELEAESRLLLVAGTDTSSTILAACCFYLVRNRPILDKVTKEIRCAFADVEDIRYAGTNLPNLIYLRACIDETLRISGSTPAHTPREVGPGGTTINGMFFPAGTVVGVSLYALHHSEEYYPDPFTFSPERWIVDPKNDVSAEGVARAQSAFGAFGLGARGCVGKNLAYVELSLTLARMLWLYDIRAKEGDHTGEGGPGKTLGRARVGEYQLEDIWVSRRTGPVIELRAR